MKRCLAAFAIAASLFAPVAHANDALEAKVRAYVPVVSLAKVCDIRINDATSGDHRAMLEAVKSDPNANKLAYRIHYETQTAYIKARDGGQRVAFCKDFIAANRKDASERAKAGQGKRRDERLERHRGNDGGHGTVLRGGKKTDEHLAAKVRAR